MIWLLGGGIQIESEDSNLYFKESDSLQIKSEVTQDLSSKFGLVSDFNRTALGSGRGRSEGVGEDLLFVHGGDGAGSHQRVTSDKHSQGQRELGGGRKLHLSGGGFGPRNPSSEIQSIEEAKENIGNKSYWPEIKKSGEYIKKEDLLGITDYGKRRDKKLEEEIFGLYHGGNGWAERFGKKPNQERVDLEFDLSKVKELLEMDEDTLKESSGKYGAGVHNPKLAQVRIFGNVEETAFNYLKHTAGPDAKSTSQLREKKIALVVVALLTGEEIGFDCDSGKEDYKQKYFQECLEANRNRVSGGRVKRVLKSAGKNGGKYGVPVKDRGSAGHKQQGIHNQPEVIADLIKMDSIKESSLLYEKCEDEPTLGEYVTDSKKSIRREVCDQILRPGFGNQVDDKRLCLIEVDNFSYYLRLNTYVQVLNVPSGHKTNTFWTKCSNYGI